MVYFGLKNDFDKIVSQLYKARTDIQIGKDFINVIEIDRDAHEELLGYKPLISGLLENKIQPKDLINDKILEDNIIKSALINVAIPSERTPKKIITVSDRIYV